MSQNHSAPLLPPLAGGEAVIKHKLNNKRSRTSATVLMKVKELILRFRPSSLGGTRTRALQPLAEHNLLVPLLRGVRSIRTARDTSRISLSVPPSGTTRQPSQTSKACAPCCCPACSGCGLRSLAAIFPLGGVFSPVDNSALRFQIETFFGSLEFLCTFVVGFNFKPRCKDTEFSQYSKKYFEKTHRLT